MENPSTHTLKRTQRTTTPVKLPKTIPTRFHDVRRLAFFKILRPPHYHLGSKSENDHINRHNQSNNNEDNMKDQDGNEHVVVEMLRSPKPFLSLKRQNSKLPK